MLNLFFDYELIIFFKVCVFIREYNIMLERDGKMVAILFVFVSTFFEVIMSVWIGKIFIYFWIGKNVRNFFEEGILFFI